MRQWEQNGRRWEQKHEVLGTKTGDVGNKNMRCWEQKHEMLG